MNTRSSISVIIATIGRPSLAETLQSIQFRPEDEILVVGTWPPDLAMDPRVRFMPHPPGGDSGGRERTAGMRVATGAYLAFLDDDDLYYASTRQRMADAIEQAPDRPTLFRVRYPSGRTIWLDRVLRFGNVSGQMILVPNDRARLGEWSSAYGHDYEFIRGCVWPEFAWDPHVVAMLGFEPEMRVEHAKLRGEAHA